MEAVPAGEPAAAAVVLSPTPGGASAPAVPLHEVQSNQPVGRQQQQLLGLLKRQQRAAEAAEDLENAVPGQGAAKRQRMQEDAKARLPPGLPSQAAGSQQQQRCLPR